MTIPPTKDLSPRVCVPANPESTWARHPDDSAWHFVDAPSGGSVVTRCAGRWPVTDWYETNARPPHADRCDACQGSVVDQRMGQLAQPANYEWPSAHEFDFGGET